MNNLNYTNKDNRKYPSRDYMDKTKIDIVIDIFILCVGVPLICLAICGLFRLLRFGMVVPIYIINLLIADLLQIIARPASLITNMANYQRNIHKVAVIIFYPIFHFGLSASVWFMVCIALERYLVVAHPLWYRCRSSVRHTVVISVGVWVMTSALPTIFFIGQYTVTDRHIVYLVEDILFSVLFLLPFPLLVFFFVGTWKAIAGATSVQDTEKRRIMRLLAFVLGSYTVLFLPHCIVYLIMYYSKYTVSESVFDITSVMVELSVLVDPVLYILLRPDVRDTLGSVPCCQRLFTLTSCWTPRAEQQETEDAAAECPTESSV